MWQQQRQQKDSAGGEVAEEGCTGGAAAVVVAAVDGVVRGDGDGRGWALQGRGASSRQLLGGLAQLEGYEQKQQQVRTLLFLRGK